MTLLPQDALLHVMTAAGWAELQRVGSRSPAPFWHLCTPAQLPLVLRRHFAGQTGLTVLHLDPATLTELRWETSEPSESPYPHLYGPLTAQSVLFVTEPRADG